VKPVLPNNLDHFFAKMKNKRTQRVIDYMSAKAPAAFFGMRQTHS
jgi:hypothetical protein